jgi:O-antigen/teichoic acid export membrane protein
MAFALLNLSQIIIKKWIGEQYVFTKFFLSLLIILMLTQNLIYSVTSYFQIVNKMHMITKQIMLVSILNISSFYFFAKIFGLEYGFISSILLDFFLLILLLMKIYINEKEKILLKQVIIDISIIFGFSLFVYKNYYGEFFFLIIYSLITIKSFYKNDS